jgi:hypothetical protein
LAKCAKRIAARRLSSVDAARCGALAVRYSATAAGSAGSGLAPTLEHQLAKSAKSLRYARCVFAALPASAYSRAAMARLVISSRAADATVAIAVSAMRIL